MYAPTTLQEQTQKYWNLSRGWRGFQEVPYTMGGLIDAVNQIFWFAHNNVKHHLAERSVDLSRQVVDGVRKPRFAKKRQKWDNVVTLDTPMTRVPVRVSADGRRRSAQFESQPYQMVVVDGMSIIEEYLFNSITNGE